MKNKALYLELKKSLLSQGITVKFWVSKYLPDIEYVTAMAQFHDNYNMSKTVKTAILDYLREEVNG